MQKNLILQNVSKSFFQGRQEIKVIKDANLEINQGEIVSMVGPSGSGKTTLLQIAGLLDNSDSGQIIISGIDVSKADDSTRTKIRKDHIGFVYQFHHLLPEFSALENIAMPLLIKGMGKKEAIEQSLAILEDIDLLNRKDHRPAELSGGQQQRVAVARAIVGKPSLLLTDEPTGNLDSENAGNIFNLICNLSKKHQISCLIVTHNIDLAKKTDRVVTIKDGILS